MSLILTEFHGSWCIASQAMRPLLGRLSKEYRGTVHFTYVNVDQMKSAYATYQIQGCPTFILFDGDKELERRVGAQSEGQLREMIDKWI